MKCHPALKVFCPTLKSRCRAIFEYFLIIFKIKEITNMTIMVCRIMLALHYFIFKNLSPRFLNIFLLCIFIQDGKNDVRTDAMLVWAPNADLCESRSKL